IIDVYMGASNLPTIGFALPVFGVQDDSEGAKGIGVVVGIRVFDKNIFDRLKQLGDTTETSETILIRSTGSMVEYLSPLADGSAPLERSLALDTPKLASVFALQKPGGFAIKRNYASKDVLVTSRPLAGPPWVVMRMITRAEALSATETRLKTILTVFTLIIAGVSVAIIAVWRHGSSLRATEALEKARISSERFENMSKFMNVVTNNQPTKIITVTADTKYAFANEPASREAGIEPKDMIGKTMASVMGPAQAQAYTEINSEVLERFAKNNDVEEARAQHIHTFGEEDSDDFSVIKSDHIPLSGGIDHPPSVLMTLNDITDLTKERRNSEKMLNQLIGTLVSVVDRRDPFSAHHSERVAEVAKSIAEEMGASEEDSKTAQIAGKLMNLGKIFIPPDLLTKTGKLTDKERSQMENSYMVSVDLLEDVDFDGPVVDTIRQFGETWDGKGPLGLSGNDILLSARILSMANAFVGMASPRAYRQAMTFEKVSNILLEQSGSKFDRKSVSALINYLENRGGMEKWSYFRDKPKEVEGE
ncbi:MAG TPA: HD domain-containing protein, partial [Rhodospirillales bacterium]|nr:HD domain-containing protein [Rhodospirillales bacterium]